MSRKSQRNDLCDCGSGRKLKDCHLYLPANTGCWCGSGEPYASCHQDRENTRWRSLGEVSSSMRMHSRMRECLAPEGLRVGHAGKIIEAHTIPKMGSLAPLAEGGCVYAFNYDSKGPEAPLDLRGISTVSTLTCFCSAHDKSIFAPIEDQAISFSQEQLFLFAYRAVVSEYVRKRKLLKARPAFLQLDRGKSPVEQREVQAMVRQFMRENLSGLSWIKSHLDEYETCLTCANWSQIRSIVVRFDRTPDVVAVTGFAPEFTFDGRLIQGLDILDLPVQLLAYSCIALPGGGGAFLLSWLPSSDAACTMFLDSLLALDRDQIPHALIRMMFEFGENVAIRPTWWRSMDPASKRAILRRHFSGGGDFPRLPTCLTDDGLRVVDWQVLDILRFPDTA